VSANPKPARILCLGVVVMDILASPVDRFPEAEKALWVKDVAIVTGGCAANTAHALGRLGASVSLLGRVGDDAFGQMIRSAMAHEGIDLSFLDAADDGTPTSTSIVLIEAGGERRFLFRPGASSDLELPLNLPLSQFDGIHVGGCFLVPRCMGQPLVDLFTRARTHQVVTSIDTVWSRHENWRDVLSALPVTDYFLPSLIEAQMITGRENPQDIADFLLANGARCVVVKMGERGSFVAHDTTRTLVPAYAVPSRSLKDTTGAGDAFVAGFLKAVHLGWSPEQAARLGNACGALATLAIGAPLQASAAHLRKVVDRVANGEPLDFPA